jgi:hypothetical protein
MNGNIKATGLAVFVAFALSAVMAVPALATTHTFDAELANTFVTGSAASAHQVFEAVPGSGEAVECTTVGITHTNKGNGEHLVDDGEMVGTLKAPGVYTENKLNLRFMYEGCQYVKNKGLKTEERVSATVTWGGCYYAFENVTDETGHASVELHCPTGEKVRITLAGEAKCWSLPDQTIPGVNYANNAGTGTGRGFTLKMAITHTTVETESAACGGAEKHFEKGTYSGEIALTGQSANVGGSATGIWVE